MLPTSGYFRDIPCPFLKHGLCQRTHCHYRHDNIVKSSYALTNTKHTTSSLSSSSSLLPIYIPTPVSKLKSVHQTITSSTSSPSASSSKSNFPEYKPTPIAQLKNRLIKLHDEERKDTVKLDKTNEKESNQSKSILNEGSDNNNHKNDVEVKLQNKEKDDEDGDENNNDINDCDKLLSDDDDDDDDDLNESKRKSLDDPDYPGYEVPSFKKPRVAHQPSHNINRKAPVKKVRLSPKEIMQQRYLKLNDKTQEKTKTSVPKTSTPKQTNVVEEKVRIAHKPTLKRPVIISSSNNKVPVKLRQLHLNKYIEELLLFCPEEESYRRGLEIEKSVYDRSTTRTIYFSLSASAVKRIREEAAQKKFGLTSLSSKTTPTKSSASTSTASQSSVGKMSKIGNRVVSHEQILNGPLRGSTFSVEKKQKLSECDLNETELYQMLKKYLLSEEKLIEYGYPRPDPKSRNCAILPQNKNDLNKKFKNNYDSSFRTCSRCKKIYQVNDKGIPIKKETCIFHSGRLWNEWFNKSLEKKYSCCKNEPGSGGCSTNKYHVIDGFDHPDYCKGYVKTLPKRPPPTSGYYGIYGLDCEMCYTTVGLEVTRVTVINTQEQIIYETLVKPLNPILDYNSKFSGIKPGDLDLVTTRLTDVQERLLTFFNDKTILIGHSLDSDLKALKMIHDTVVDTAQVFPHKKGLPYKRALRTLTAEYLKKIIQQDVDGHDSREDAVAAMKLMLWKVKEDLKLLQK